MYFFSVINLKPVNHAIFVRTLIVSYLVGKYEFTLKTWKNSTVIYLCKNEFYDKIEWSSSYELVISDYVSKSKTFN